MIFYFSFFSTILLDEGYFGLFGIFMKKRHWL